MLGKHHEPTGGAEPTYCAEPTCWSAATCLPAAFLIAQKQCPACVRARAPTVYSRYHLYDDATLACRCHATKIHCAVATQEGKSTPYLATQTVNHSSMLQDRCCCCVCSLYRCEEKCQFRQITGWLPISRGQSCTALATLIGFLQYMPH